MLAHNDVQAGYYWPRMNRDSYEMVKHCGKCQRFDKAITNLPEELSLVSTP
jgi:hypothetical protein